MIPNSRFPIGSVKRLKESTPDRLDGLLVIYLGWSNGYEWVRSLETRIVPFHPIKIGTEFAWIVDYNRTGYQDEE